MSFGSELKDQVSTVNQYIQNGIQFMHEFREFVKERAQIEKEYASKIEGLAKKHLLKKEKKAISMSIGDVANTLSEKDFNEAKSEPSTFLNAWARILEETENVAKERYKFSESISTKIMEELKTVSIKKEEMRKKHIQFSNKLALERDKMYSENQKAKARYNESCLEALNSQQKQEKAPDEKVLEKLRKQTQEAIIDMNNNKNLYILSIRMTNEHKHKYYNSDIPSLIDQLQELNESRTNALKRIWDDCVNLELNVLNDSIKHLNSTRRDVQSIDDRKDSELFIKYNKQNNQEEPPDFDFVSSSAFDDDDVLVNDENASVFLSNKLSKSRQRLSELTQEIETKKKQLDGLLSLKDAYENNHKLGDSDTVTE
ncbi:4892_t:CDS:10 [Diversispora eburnea]|uniref:Protein BZZ1 n=1 Tax=Diversispora eburnea TaxID=1213867 RepID=A0A9N9BUK7_9GLOM|nr:4892_t:CDS:10 [Diversispora eburnea]